MKVVRIYRLHDGILKLIESISQPTVAPNRQKGRFEHRTSGQMMGSGEVMNRYSKEEQCRFLSEINKATKKIRAHYDRVFLFAPLRFSVALQSALPKKMQEKITRKFSGNYTNKHETDLLAMIKERRLQRKKQNSTAPRRKEVIKLLKPKPRK